MKKVHIKKDRDKSLKRKHPWVFSGAINKADENIKPGETISVVSSSGQVIGKGAFSPSSQISIRMWTFNDTEEVNTDFFKRRIINAFNLRKEIISGETDSYRIINAESDGLPGVIADLYGKHLCCQFLSAGAEFWKNEIVNLLAEIIKPVSIYERSDNDVRIKEGLNPSAGTIWGSEPEELLEISENGLRFKVDLKAGHKTGFYLDQRDNRQLISSYVDKQAVLNCFSYTGGFSIYALNNNAASVTSIDSSESSLELLNKNIELNNLNPAKNENIAEDVFKTLRKFRDEGRSFDVIILDPPKFAESYSQVQKASRGYKDINLLALKLLNPGGTLFTFSCSGHISPDLFQKIVADAALDSGREAKIIKLLSQASDHMVVTNFPEGFYLKGLVLRVS